MYFHILQIESENKLEISGKALFAIINGEKQKKKTRQMKKKKTMEKRQKAKKNPLNTSDP